MKKKTKLSLDRSSIRALYIPASLIVVAFFGARLRKLGALTIGYKILFYLLIAFALIAIFFIKE